MVYRFIDDNKKNFGVRWLLRRFKLSANAYHNYLKGRKDSYRANKKKIKDAISTIYHETNGILGYRTMKIFLERKGIVISKLTTHKYMNKDLKIKSVTQKKKPNYKHGKAHEKFANLINQDFTATKKNTIWCTDFTYLTLTNGSKRCNCTIIDLYDRSVVATLNGKEITSELAINTIKKAFAA